MPAHLRLVAASKPCSPERDATAHRRSRRAVGQHQPVPTTPEFDAYLRKIDRADRCLLERTLMSRPGFDSADDLWIPAAVVAIILFVGGLAFYLGGRL